MEMFVIGIACVVLTVVAMKTPNFAAKVKAWWGKGKAELASLRGDIAGAHDAVGEFKGKFEGEIAALKDRLKRAGIAE